MWEIALLIGLFSSAAPDAAAASSDGHAHQPSRPRRLRRVCIVAGVFVSLFLLTAPPDLHPDSVYYLLLARECALFGVCGHGSLSQGWLNGAPWVQLLAACRVLGLGVTGMKAVGAFAYALAALLVDGVYQRYFRGTAPPVWVVVVWIAAAPLLVGFPGAFWNPAMLPLTSALFFYFFFRFVERGDWRAAMCGAVALGIMCDAHLVGGLLVLFFLFAIGLRSRKPAIMALAVTGTVILVALADAPGAWIENAKRAAHHLHPGLVLAALAPVAAVYAGTRFRGVRSIRDTRVAVWWAKGMLLATALALVVVAAAAGVSPDDGGNRYFGILMPVVAISVAGGLWTLARAAGRFSAALVPRLLVAMLALMAVGSVVHDGLNLCPAVSDIERLATWLHARGYRGDAIAAHVGGEAGYAVRRALLAFEDAEAAAGADSLPMVDVEVLPGYLRRSLPAGWEALSGGAPVGRFIAVSSIRSFVKRGTAELCVDAPNVVCKRWSPVSYAAYEAYRAVPEQRDGARPGSTSYTYQVEVPAGSESHVIQTHAGWLVTAASGVELRGDLPTARCIIAGGTERHGTIRFSRPGSDEDPRSPPLWTEASVDAEQLLGPIRWPYFRVDEGDHLF